jgi:hypothetical protein
MMGSGMMFSEIISTIQTTFFPVDKKLALANPIAYPVVTHIHSFGTFLSDSIIGDATGSAIIGDNTGRRLGMTKLNKNVGWAVPLRVGETGKGVQASGSGRRGMVDAVGVPGTLSDGMG